MALIDGAGEELPEWGDLGYSAKGTITGGGLIRRDSPDVYGDLFHDRRLEGRRTQPGYRWRLSGWTSRGPASSYSSTAMTPEDREAWRSGKAEHYPFDPRTFEYKEGGHPPEWYPPRYS